MIIQGDCLTVMKNMSDNSIDFLISDPPYGLNFMGKKWDQSVIGVEYWKEAIRICKPGAMLAIFGGTRTYHRLTCAVEDSGFVIRDCIMWVYGSGFPKSHNLKGKINEEWDKYGTALKPAYEPIILAMKRLDDTFAQNAEKWGVAGINIDDSRVEGKRWPANLILDEEAGQALDQQSGYSKSSIYNNSLGNTCGFHGSFERKIQKKRNDIGGYTDFGGASRFFYCAKASASERNKGLEGMPLKSKGAIDLARVGNTLKSPTNALRKDKSTKSENFHPTVKPIALMKYLITLLAPPGNPTLLDPFAGSGTTLLAAKELGIHAIGIEIDPEYCEIARKRCKL